MGKTLKRACICLILVTLIGAYWLISDSQAIKHSMIRFHVVANSDSAGDQNVKLLVRDAVLQSIQEDLKNVADMEQAKAYMQDSIPKIESLANTVLEAAGFEEQAVVTFCRERFPSREYDTFSLPSGVYEALRIVIGEGAGENWWCVTFPALCMPATAEGFVEAASQSGLPNYLVSTLENNGEYDIHFYFLDVIGQIENHLIPG